MVSAAVAIDAWRREVCATCLHRSLAGHCEERGYPVPDDYVCADWQRQRPVLWRPGENQDGD